jgi:transglutaminase-like putative cysteine protease
VTRAFDDAAGWLAATPSVDHEHPRVRGFVATHDVTGADPRTRAVALYYAVRDLVRYDPYAIDLSTAGLAASRALETGRGWCVTKAVLLAACCRAIGVPARLGYADVKNHLSTARLRELMRTDEFRWHGYASLLLEGRWVKATPAFNVELCAKFGLHPLEFDGRGDSLYHPYDRAGRQHMEYLRYRGEFADVPAAEIRADFTAFYGHMMDRLAGGDFHAEAAREHD